MTVKMSIFAWMYSDQFFLNKNVVCLPVWFKYNWSKQICTQENACLEIIGWPSNVDGSRPAVNIKPYRLSCVRLCARALSDETVGQWLSCKREDISHAENCQAQQYAPSVSFVFPLTPPPWNARTHLPLRSKVHAKSLCPKLGFRSCLAESGIFSTSL